MPKGGARTRSGPGADPNSLRQLGKADEWVRLPASGRPGDAPEWPLLKPTDREKAIWADLWSRPQAIEWDRQRQHFEVALFVRRLVEAEEHESAVALSTLVRQMSDSLGLTTAGMRANRWLIVDDAPVAEETTPARSSSRNRLRVVSDGGA